MLLADSLRIEPGQVVAFVGAGGKSTAINRLVRELKSHIPVIVSTTTKIALDQKGLAQQHLTIDSNTDLKSAIERLPLIGSMVITGPMHETEPKWIGLGLDLVESLIQIVKAEGYVLLIEADGARGRSLKAPAEYEPSLPLSCDLVVPMVGLDVIGEEITSLKIHRPEIVERLLDLGVGEQIMHPHIVSLMTSTQGALKDIPASSSVRMILNKIDSEEDLENGRRIALDLIKNARVQSVLLTSMIDDSPVIESITRVAGIVLAAGASTRLDSPKQLEMFHRKPLVAHSVETALEGGLDPVVVVVGAEGEAIKKALESYPIHFMENSEPERGQSSSMQLGLQSVQDQVEAAIFLLVDMPLIKPDLIRALLNQHRQSLASIIAPYAGGKRGNPILFDRRTFQSLMGVQGDQGGRALFSSFPVVQLDWDDSVLFDIDTEDDLRRMREME